jgi:hypothetical protein
MELAAGTVAGALRSQASRAAALDALEALAPPIPSAVALAAAPALVDVMTAAEQAERASFDRSGLLLARLLDEAAPEPAALYGAALGGERLASFHAAGMLAEAFQRASSSAEQPLTREDARSYVCWFSAHDNPAYVRGVTAPLAAAGYTVMEWVGMVRFLALATQTCFALTPVALSARADDGRGGSAFVVPESDALRRRAAADADAAGRADQVGGVVGAGKQCRARGYRTVLVFPRQHCTGLRGAAAWAHGARRGTSPCAREPSRRG